MGAGASTALPDEIDLATAQSFAGDKFDEAKFNSAAVDGKVSKDAFLKAATAAPSLAERISVGVFHPFRFETAVESVQACIDAGSTELTLPIMVELSAAMLELPNLATLTLGAQGSTGGVDAAKELIGSHRRPLNRDGYGEAVREVLRSEKEARLAKYGSLAITEQALLLDAVGGCCNEEHRDRVRSTLSSIFLGDVSSLVLDESLLSDGPPPALEQLGKLAELRILDLTRNMIGAVPEYLGNLTSLEQLIIYDCGLTELPSSLGKLHSLEKLIAGDNKLPRLPESFAELKSLGELDVFNNQFTVLPRWIADLPKLHTLGVGSNPWQLPPLSVIKNFPGVYSAAGWTDDRNWTSGDEQGTSAEALKRYYTAIEAHGSSTSRKAKLVLVGTGEAGKSSTLRGLKHREARPFAPEERTVQLDIWTLAFGEPPEETGAEDHRIIVSAWDFAGQPEYAAGQQQYLVRGALYLLLVPAHRTTDEEAEEVLTRWLDALQARAPGAVVQIILSHCDKLQPIAEKLTAGGDLEELLEEDPNLLTAAAGPQLAWIKTQLEQHEERMKGLATEARSGTFSNSTKHIELLKVQDTIPCVCAAEGGDASLIALYNHLNTLLTSSPPLLPSVGFTIPGSWLPALALPAALRDGLDPVAAAKRALDSDAQAATPSADANAPKLVKRPYLLLSELSTLWKDIAAKILPDEKDPLSVLTDALDLLGNQGEIFEANGIVFLDPGFATELLRPLVDHTLSVTAAEKDVAAYVRATPGLATDEAAPQRILDGINELCTNGRFSVDLLPFLWRATALDPKDYERAKSMLCDAGVLIPSDAWLMMPMRMPRSRSKGVEALWPAEASSGQVELSVTFSFLGVKLPPGAIERCVGCVGALQGCRLLECWRLGALLSDVASEGKTVALLELGAAGVSLTAQVRGSGEAAGLWPVLTPLVAAVERVLSDYSGIAYSKETSE